MNLNKQTPEIINTISGKEVLSSPNINHRYRENKTKQKK